jgi:hypothetical protein
MRFVKVFILSLVFSSVYSQEKLYDFTAFGHLPAVVSNNYFVNLNNAETKEIRLQYLDTIARIYLRSGHADSLIHYGKLLKDESRFKDSIHQNIKDFNLKGFYFEGVLNHTYKELKLLIPKMTFKNI